MILTSAARSGGEVRITEAERTGRIRPGRRGAGAGTVAHDACASGCCTTRGVCGNCQASGIIAARYADGPMALL